MESHCGGLLKNHIVGSEMSENSFVSWAKLGPWSSTGMVVVKDE